MPKDIRVRVFVTLITLAGAGLMVAGGWKWRGEDLAALLALALLAMVAERFDLSLYGDSRVSLTVAPILAAVLLAGLAGLALVVPLAMLASTPGTGRPVHKTLFNLGALMLAGAGSALVFHLFGPAARPEAWPEVLGPSALAAAANFAINSLLVATAVSLSTGASLATVWNEKFRWLMPHFLVMGLLGLTMATAYGLMGLWGIAVFLVPPVMMRYSLKQYVDRTTKNVLELKQAHEELQEAHGQVVEAMERLKRAYDGTLQALIAALDTRDSETRGHSERVVELALAIAEEMGIASDSRGWQELQWAALLHDVGKIGVPDSILRKTGGLSDEDWQAMREHPTAGHEILRDVEFLGAAAEIVYAHHERYDGFGYPRGLAGEAIPLGARIFSVADAFDAMTSDRPYRAALAIEAALVEVLRNSGSQFDPEVVDAFLRVYVRRFVPRRKFDARDTQLSQAVKKAISEVMGER